MKSISTQLSTALATGTAIRAVPVVVVDWNLNRYHDVKADNMPTEQDAGYDVELFPVESIVAPNRPDKGINKARVGYARISDDYKPMNSNYNSARFYVADVDDQYKYWTSPLPATGGIVPVVSAANFPADTYPDITTYDNLTSARPFITYGTWDATDTTGETINGADVQANKIVIKLENSWASPNDFDILITNHAGTTTTIHATDLTIPWEGTGNIVLRWNGTTWVDNLDWPVMDSTTEMPQTTAVETIQLVVRTLKGGYEKTAVGDTLVPTTYLDASGNTQTTDGSDGYFDLIEISAHLEADLSPFVIDTSTTLDMSDVSNLYPLGTVTTNVGSLTLSNLHKDPSDPSQFLPGAFDERNTAMPWSDYLEPNAKVEIYYDFYDESGVGSTFLERVRELSMYTGQWTGQAADQVSVELADYSTFFNTQNVSAALWENIPATQAVWRVLDSVGFSNYIITDDVNDFNIPVFYMSADQNVWEVLGEIAKDTQTAIYFDAYGVLHVKPRGAAFSSAAAATTLTTVDSANQLANIVSFDQTESFEPNYITVSYQATDWEAYKANNPVLQKVWEPEGDEVLRSTPLVRSLSTADDYFWITAKDALIWLYEGLVNIDGELIRYKGKQVNYFTGANGGTLNTTVVNSQDEYDAIQAKVDVKYRYKTHFTGAMKIAIDEFGAQERGVWNSETVAHSVDATGYSVHHIQNGTHRANVGGFLHLKSQSKVRLASTHGFKDYKDILVATHGATTDSAFYSYGTKFRFVKAKGRTTQRAGILIHNSGTTEDGYYIELTPSKNLGGKERKTRQELMLYSRVSGKDYVKGKAALAIGENIDYELDITYRYVSGDHQIQVWVNGKKVLSKTITTNKNTANGRFGMFLRGKSKVQYEYLYAIAQTFTDPPDDFSYMDKIKRGYVGSQWDREWVYRWRTRRRRVKKKWRRERYRWNRRFFDDFGPYVHEVREYNVKLDPSPVQNSRLYLTNDWSAAVLEYKATPFDASFIIANADRQNAVINGEDTLSYAGTGASINQVLNVFGRVLVQQEDATIVAQNKEQVNARGKNESELSGTWIQTKAMAQALADWINYNFTYGNEGAAVEIYGNPAYEIGDIVHVTYPDKHIDADYFIVGINNSFSDGYQTSLTLRERVV